MADPLLQQGETPLHHSCDSGWTEVVALLLDRGADLHVRDEVSMHGPLPPG